MIHLLFTLIVAEMGVILLLLFRTPLRKLVIMGLDRMKRGRGPVIVTTVGGTILVLLISTVSNVINVRQREEEPGSINPTDQILFVRSLLDASLMGFRKGGWWFDEFGMWLEGDGRGWGMGWRQMCCQVVAAVVVGFILFLGLMMDRLHHYIRELRLLRKTMEAAKKQNRSFDDAKSGNVEEQVAALKSQIKTLESECAAKTDEAKAEQSKAEALKKQSEGLLLEYDRVLEDNQHLRSQLQELSSDGKKNM
ncbi:hypothetical protein KSS87_013346 [Heliosperma pusillum]|nr:hypothetical protein KSS87_013346 [Heliosperma pusillum]